MLDKLTQRAKALQNEIYALYLASRDPRAPWYAKAIIACVLAYAVSPIDLIPDFIPVLGYLDDLVLLPLGIYLALKLLPPAVLADARLHAHRKAAPLPMRRCAAWIIIGVWLIALIGVAMLIADALDWEYGALIGA